MKTSKDAYVALFDFVAVGEYEILLHRYDLNGRLANLPDDMQGAVRRPRTARPIRPSASAATSATSIDPRAAHRRQRRLHRERAAHALRQAARPARSSRCPRARPPATRSCAPPRTATSRRAASSGIKCSGGKGGLAIVYTESANPRGYELITIYDD